MLESYGAGNIPSNRQDILDVIEKTVKRGVIVVVITQCSNGAVAPLYETGQVRFVRLCKCLDLNG